MTIMVGYVPRDEGVAALRVAVEEAKLRDLPLVVVAMENVGDPQTTQAATHHKENLEQARGKAAKTMAAAEQYLTEAGVPYETRTLVSSADPGDAMIELAEEEKAAFIVIGLRRRTAVGKLVFGSNAQRILLNAPCPVIAVHASDR